MSATPRQGSFADLPADEPYTGIERRVLDAERATVSRYLFQPGARFPQHVHPQEQVTLVEEGRVELNVAGERSTLQAGDWSVVPAEVEHGITAGERGASLLAIVVPRRTSANAYTVVE